MYEFYGIVELWFSLNSEEENDEAERAGMAHLEKLVAELDLGGGHAGIHHDTSSAVCDWLVRAPIRLSRTGVAGLLAAVCADMPASHGVVYERWQGPNAPVPPGPGAFRVLAVARGEIQVRLDPFFSFGPPLHERCV